MDKLQRYETTHPTKGVPRLRSARSRGRLHAHALRVQWAPSRLRRVGRHPALWWLLAITCVVGGGASLTQRAHGLEQARLSWGETRSVAVVVQPIGAGERVIDSVEIRQVPIALVAVSAVEAPDRDAFARVDLVPGEVVLAERLSTHAAGEVPPAMAAVTVSLVRASPLVTVGDLVDLWAVDTAAGRSKRVAVRVVVLAQQDDALTVAVPQADVGDIALAAVRPLTAAMVG